MEPIIPSLQDLIRIDDYTYEIPQSYRDDMRVAVRIFCNQRMLEDIVGDKSLWQLVNVATLPGIQRYAFAMPDMHQGYGFPIGGVAAMAIDEGGVISPGGIGYDINCGVRLLVANHTAADIKTVLPTLATRLFDKVPSGVGRGGKLDYGPQEMDKILRDGARHMLSLGYGNERDIECCEESGSMGVARPELITDKAKKRGSDQLGTLGSGNHFLEVQVVDEVFDKEAAQAYGLSEGIS